MPRKRRYVPPFSSWFFDPFEEPNSTNMNEACGFKISNVCDQLLANAKENDNGNRSDSETSDSNQVFQRRYCGVVHDARSGARHAVMVLRVVHAAFGGKGRMLALLEKPE